MRIALLCLVICACGSRERTKTGEPVVEPTPSAAPISENQPQPRITALLAEAQRPGDAQAGYRALVGNNYVGCGVPRSLVDRFFGSTAPAWLLEGRPGLSEGLPYFLNGYETSDGTAMVTANCLSCHASMLEGRLIVGLGETRLAFNTDATMPLRLADFVGAEGEAGKDLRKLIGRVRAIAPYIQTRVVGPNAADSIAAVLFAHRDPKTLAWSDEMLLQEPTKEVAPVDVPAWWLLKKKNAMFYTGAGRGDHARIMMTTSALCTDSVERAREIDAYFPDVRAFVLSLEAPAYPYAVEQDRARAGERVFAKRCTRCHGSYGASEQYPNLLVSLSEVGTDPWLAVGSAQFAAPYVAWFSQSFYGEIARLEPGNGYVAPPLDGIWATAPYLHNASVPTLAALLNSTTRPATWMDSGSRSMYLEEALGFPYAEAGKDEIENARDRVYDTAMPGYGNGGHTYGDSLSDAERMDLLEYLKTL